MKANVIYPLIKLANVYEDSVVGGIETTGEDAREGAFAKLGAN